MSSSRPVHVGCSGWSYKEWRGVLYPEGLPTTRWLQRYAEEFSTVEVNNTFYRLPSPSAVENWIERTPPDFIFTLKVSRYLTHVKRLKETERYVKRFMEPLEALRGSSREGPFLWQLPANFPRDDERLSATLKALPVGRHCFEFRDPSWFCREVYELLREHRAALVIGDDPERPFQSHELTADWTLIRFHRGSRGRNGKYSASELDTWARRLRQWRRKVEVFAYFNNDWKGYAVENAAALRDALGS
ncbi:MAG: DUF72 domain-containing protein [Solirubrobacterales bacterium]